ncbi:vq [Abeliophyllum distichum]|uniref:Vq n=1 Tax=Abeliophyllum distichum TaxID=126358 RepID=A0ABD1TKY9_9LAMI
MLILRRSRPGRCYKSTTIFYFSCLEDNSDQNSNNFDTSASSSSTRGAKKKDRVPMMKLSAPKIRLDPELTGRTKRPMLEDKMLEFAQKISFKSVVQKLTGKDLAAAAAKSFSTAKHVLVTFIAQKLRSPSDTHNSHSTHHYSLPLLSLIWISFEI